MLLIFKMNDCLRHVDNALGSPTNTLVRITLNTIFHVCASAILISCYEHLKVVAGKYASERVLASDNRKYQSDGRYFDMFRSWLSYFNVLFRIKAYELWNGMLMC